MKTNKILAIGLLAAATVLTTGCSDSFLVLAIINKLHCNIIAYLNPWCHQQTY